MKAQKYKETTNVSGADIVIVKAENGTLYAYDTAERWNGEYYKGWKCDEQGYETEQGIWNIKPVYQGVGEQDQDGVYEEYELIGYEV